MSNYKIFISIVCLLLVASCDKQTRESVRIHADWYAIAETPHGKIELKEKKGLCDWSEIAVYLNTHPLNEGESIIITLGQRKVDGDLRPKQSIAKSVEYRLVKSPEGPLVIERGLIKSSASTTFEFVGWYRSDDEGSQRIFDDILNDFEGMEQRIETY